MKTEENDAKKIIFRAEEWTVSNQENNKENSHTYSISNEEGKAVVKEI